MKVKSDTKERFTVITPQEASLSVIMTEELRNLLLPYLQKDIPHIVLNLSAVSRIDPEAAPAIAAIQQEFYAANQSCVLCCLQPDVEKVFGTADLLDTMNITPSESEAWDIVQMEEIEREFLRDE